MKIRSFRTIYIGWLSFKGTFTNLNLTEYLFTKIVYPFFQLLFFVLVASFANKNVNITKLVLGNSIILCTFSCIFDMGLIFVRDRYFGTLKFLVINEKKLIKIFIERGIFYILDSLLTIVSSFIAGFIVFNLSFSSISLLSIIIIISISLLSGIAIGLLLAVISLVITEINLVYNLITLLFVFITGVNIPFENLPIPVRIVSNIFPLTHLFKAVDLLLYGNDQFYFELLYEIIIILLMISFSYVGLLKMIKLSKEKGLLDLC